MSELAIAPSVADQALPANLAVLDDARKRAFELALPYAGGISPHDAWILVGQGLAHLVDVRSAEELKFVGHVPDTLHVPWATGLSLTRNPRFVRDLEKKVGRDEVIVFLCRSGNRSAAAAQEATKAGYKNAFNILEGFEGERNERQQRGEVGGWRRWGLPWAQD